MRYRVLEVKDRGCWIPVTTIFAAEGKVYRFTVGRSSWAEVDVEELEAVTTSHLPETSDPGQFRLSPVRTVEFPEHWIERKAREMGEVVDPDFLQENHIALLEELRHLARAARLGRPAHGGKPVSRGAG